MKLMKHPNHGFHHAYNTNEEETMRKNGWSDHIPEPVAVVAESVASVVEAEPEVADEPVKRGPGRPRKA